MPAFHYILFSIAGYLIGSFPTGVVLSRKKYRIDIREMGSGNIGATNITRVFGWSAGIFTLLVDFLKSFLPLYWLHFKYPMESWLLTSVGIALVLGHCFSVFLRFKGGKGVATSLGCLIVVAPQLALIGSITYFLLLVVTKISAVGSLGGIGVALTSALLHADLH